MLSTRKIHSKFQTQEMIIQQPILRQILFLREPQQTKIINKLRVEIPTLSASNKDPIEEGILFLLILSKKGTQNHYVMFVIL